MVRPMAMAGVLMGLVGCSGTPQPPQEMPESFYATMARNEAWLETCNEAGMLSAEIAGEGTLLAQQDRQNYAHSPAKLNALKEQTKSSQVASKETCSKIGAFIHALYLKEFNKNTASGNNVPQQNPYGRTTNCSTVYGWTNCYSY